MIELASEFIELLVLTILIAGGIALKTWLSVQNREIKEFLQRTDDRTRKRIQGNTGNSDTDKLFTQLENQIEKQKQALDEAEEFVRKMEEGG